MKRQKGNEGEEYINAFPKLKKWINECLCCHEKGYNLLFVNEEGLCSQCEKILKNKK